MKKKHRLINIIYNNDRIYTRPERVMVVLVYLLYTMVSGPYYYKIGYTPIVVEYFKYDRLQAVNCFLFIFAAASTQGRTVWDRIGNQLVFAVISVTCQVCPVPTGYSVSYLILNCLNTDTTASHHRASLPKNSSGEATTRG